MVRPLVHSEEMRDLWVDMRIEGYSVRQISEKTGVSPNVIAGYFGDIGITHRQGKEPDEVDETPDELIKIDNLYLEPECAIRYLKIRASHGLGIPHMNVETGNLSLEQELELERVITINKNNIN